VQAEDNAAKGKLRLAAEDYKAALALDPDHTANNVHLYLGLCKTLVKLGRGKEAISSCTEALNIEGELVDALTQVKLPGLNKLYGTFVTSQFLVSMSKILFQP
jgi:tetratricopeptide (TPR) repeat protein